MQTVNSAARVGAQKVYTVSEITRQIRTLLESNYRTVWIEGEISNFKRQSSGHIYFTLKDETAQISAVFFAGDNQFLKFQPKDGLQVILIGRISVYDKRGQYQIYVQRMEPKGLGALQLAFQQLKTRLEQEGLFAKERKKPIPRYPQRIGIVTSPTGAAIEDMLKIFRRRAFGLHVFLMPVRVQGDGAAQEISDAIDQLNRFEPLDLLIVGRGGGSLEDLWAFNEEIVARAIQRSSIPVVSAVGHEVDWTIADFVADFRAHTPTAAAEQVVSNWDELQWLLRQARDRMRNQMRGILDSKRETLANLKESYAFRQPKVWLEQIAQHVDELARQLRNYLNGVLDAKKQLFRTVAGKLEALSPLAILDRGYSITFDEQGHLITDANQTEVDKTIRTKLKGSMIHSKVTALI